MSSVMIKPGTKPGLLPGDGSHPQRKGHVGIGEEAEQAVGLKGKQKLRL